MKLLNGGGWKLARTKRVKTDEISRKTWLFPNNKTLFVRRSTERNFGRYVRQPAGMVSLSLNKIPYLGTGGRIFSRCNFASQRVSSRFTHKCSNPWEVFICSKLRTGSQRLFWLGQDGGRRQWNWMRLARERVWVRTLKWRWRGRLPRLPDPSTVSSDEHWSALGARSTHRRAFPLVPAIYHRGKREMAPGRESTRASIVPWTLKQLSAKEFLRHRNAPTVTAL